MALDLTWRHQYLSLVDPAHFSDALRTFTAIAAAPNAIVCSDEINDIAEECIAHATDEYLVTTRFHKRKP